MVLHRDVIVIPASRYRHLLTQAPADDGASHVVCSAPGVGGDIVHSSDLGRANGTPLVFFVERGSPPEVSSEGSRSRDPRWRAGTPPYVDNWLSVCYCTSAIKVRSCLSCSLKLIRRNTNKMPANAHVPCFVGHLSDQGNNGETSTVVSCSDSTLSLRPGDSTGDTKGPINGSSGFESRPSTYLFVVFLRRGDGESVREQNPMKVGELLDR